MEKAKRKFSVQKCFVVILLVQVLALVGWCIAKKGYFIDELFTYGMCNGEQFRSDFYYMYDDYLNNWHDSSLFHEYLTVQKDGRFDFAGVVENVSADVHPPIYFMIVHAMCSLMPDVFTKWFGLLPNIAFFIITQILLYLISSELFEKEKHMALVPVILYGFSVGAINSVTLIRAYMMLAMLCTLQFYIHMRLWRALRSNDRKREGILLIVLACSTCVGFLTQYYYVIFAFFVSAAYSVIQMLRKNRKHFLKYAVAMFGGLGGAYILFPACYQQILGKEGVNTYRGEEAFENLKNSNLGKRLSAYSVIVDQELFGGLMKYAVIIGMVAAVVYVVLKCVKFTITQNEEGHLIEISKRQVNQTIGFKVTEKGLLAFIATVGCVVYTVVLSKIAAFETDRYIFCIYPLVMLCFCYIMRVLSVHFHWKSNYCIAALLVVALTGYAFAYNGDGVCYMYRDDEKRYEQFDEYSNIGVVYVTEGDWSNVSNMLYLSKVESVYCVPQRNISDLSTALDEYSSTHDEVLVIIENYQYGDRIETILRDILDTTEYNEYEFELFIDDNVYRLKKGLGEGELPSGYYTLKSVDGQVLCVENDQTDNLANVIAVSGREGSTVFCRKMDSVYEMTFVHSNKMLDVNNGLAEEGTNIQQYEWNGLGAQEWTVKPADDGERYYVLFRNDYAMTVNSETGNVELKTFNGDESQQWIFEHKES